MTACRDIDRKSHRRDHGQDSPGLMLESRRSRSGCPSRRRHPTSPGGLRTPTSQATRRPVIECKRDVKGSKITVKDDVVTVGVAGLPTSDHEKLIQTLSTIAGVTRVVVVELPSPPATAAPAGAPLPTTAPTPTGPAVEAEVPRRGLRSCRRVSLRRADRGYSLATLLRHVPALPGRTPGSETARSPP
jgi:hypothetical protein